MGRFLRGRSDGSRPWYASLLAIGVVRVTEVDWSDSLGNAIQNSGYRFLVNHTLCPRGAWTSKASRPAVDFGTGRKATTDTTFFYAILARVFLPGGSTGPVPDGRPGDQVATVIGCRVIVWRHDRRDGPMHDDPFFGLYGYHLALAAVGCAIIGAYWLPRWVSRREPAASGILILLGMAAFALVPGVPVVPDPRVDPYPL